MMKESKAYHAMMKESRSITHDEGVKVYHAMMKGVKVYHAMMKESRSITP